MSVKRGNGGLEGDKSAEKDDQAQLKRRRQLVKYQPKYERFILREKNYVQQYNLLYLARLKDMRPRLTDQVAAIWRDEVPLLEKIIDIEVGHAGKEVALIGTLYKDMPLRGSILDEFKEKNGISGTVQSLYDISSPEDTLVMEDESGRIALSGVVARSVGQLVTGVVVAVRGTLDAQGALQVSDLLTSFDAKAQQQQQQQLDCSRGKINCTERSKFVLLVSGLQIGNPLKASDSHTNSSSSSASSSSSSTSNQSTLNSELSAQLLIDFVAGRLHEHADVDIASKIVRVIVAGDSVAPMDPSVAKERQSGPKSQRLAEAPSKQLDSLLGQLLSCCDVDIMPGNSDPTNISLPQQPLHPCLFPHSCRFSSFSRVSNPYEAAFDGCSIAGHSGQPLQDIMRQQQTTATAAVTTHDEDTATVAATATATAADGEAGEAIVVAAAKGAAEGAVRSEAEKSLDVLQDTLRWGHLCPTCPDTLPCYPFTENDPFVLYADKLPDILFAANQAEFGSRLLEVEKRPLRLISVPTFAAAASAVLVDIASDTLDCFTISFR